MGSHGSVMADSARDKRNAAEAARDEWDAAKAAAEETLIQRNRLDKSLAECKKQLKKCERKLKKCERKLKKCERKLAEQRDATSEAYKKFLGARFQSESWDDVSGSPSLSDLIPNGAYHLRLLMVIVIIYHFQTQTRRRPATVQNGRNH